MIEKINQNPDLTLSVALVGIFPEEINQQELILTRVRRVMDSAIKCAGSYNKPEYGYSDKTPSIHFLTSPSLTNELLIKTLKEKYYPDAKYICVSETELSGESVALYETITVTGKNDNPYISGNAILRSWICDQVDFAVVINEEGNPLYVDFIKQCKNVGIPAANIFPQAGRHLLWVEKSFYESFEEDKMCIFLDAILNVKTLIDIEDDIDDKDYKLLWKNLYSNYMKKHKAIIDTSQPTTEDTLANPALDINFKNPEAKEVRENIVGWFQKFDHKANNYSEKYHASIYLRSVMPLITSILLAFGFYTEAIFGFWPINLFGTQLTVSSLIACLGFFASGMLTYYVYRLSEKPSVLSWHQRYTDNRYIAETLRMAVHFIPYGIPVNYSMHNRYGTKEENTRLVLHRLRNFLKGINMPNTVFDRSDSTECLHYLEEFLNDQIAYHKRSANRFMNIIDILKKYYKIIFYIGFIIVLLRAALQVYTTFAPIPGTITILGSSTVLGATGSIKLNSYIETFANMLALLIPAWAAYFNSKLTLCNWEGLYNNDVRMMEGLQQIKQRIVDEKQKEYLSYQDIYYISKDVNALMLGEISEWYYQINSKKVTKL